MKKYSANRLLLVLSIAAITIFATGCPAERTVQTGSSTTDTSGTGGGPKKLRKTVKPKTVKATTNDTSTTGGGPK